MAEIFKFFNSAPGDERWHYASDFADYFGSVLSSGLISNGDLPVGLQVTVNAGTMTTSVNVGKALIKGYSYENTTPVKLTHSISEQTLDRIDRIVLRLDLKNASRFIKVFVKEGVSALEPIAPTLQRDQYVYELSLAQIRIRKNTSSLVVSDIKDERANENLCGIVQSLITVPTSVFEQQFNAWFEGSKRDLTNEFHVWFETVKDYLNDTAVGNVANKLVEHEMKVMHVHWLDMTAGLNDMSVNYPEIHSYVNGLAISFVVSKKTSNPATININNLGAIPIVNTAKEPQSELRENGVYSARYLNGNFILQGSIGDVDNTAQISNLQAVVGLTTAGTIKLNWKNPADLKYKGVRILYKTGSYPNNPTDGTVFYDSSDAVPVSTFTKNGFIDGSTYYIRAFAYTYKNATRVYTTSIDGAQVMASPYNSKGMQTFTSSGMFTVPYGITSIDVFLVGGGGSGGHAGRISGSITGGGGGGGGYTTTVKNIKVTPGSKFNVLVGAGGAAPPENTQGNNGGNSTFDTYNATGGKAGLQPTSSVGGIGGAGGSAGGNGKYNVKAEDGASNGGSTSYGVGQGKTTRSFEESSGTLYCGGGGGGGSNDSSSDKAGLGGEGGGGIGASYANSTNGSPNTGGGGGGGASITRLFPGAGGSGIVIVRWGY